MRIPSGRPFAITVIAPRSPASSSTASRTESLADTAGNGFKAYAHVNADGTVDTANSSGIGNANVVLLLTSSYCFHDLPFSFHGAIVTPDHALAIPDKEAAFVAPATCWRALTKS